MNKKGFTLTELLAVIVVLAILIGIASQVSINLIAKSRQKTAEEMEETLKDAAITYYIDCLEKQNSCSKTVSVSYLKENGFFDDSKNICKNEQIIINEDNNDYDAVVPKDTCLQ